ncbi:hypothetical protein [Alkalicoccus halolimnae]|uniref:Uncharacterized protein n=1 Tax=Alkalicoccus halolimnae TaxID=1667239 RepID=A0A5C7F4J6_9BACI|nr:hypothetical protein [Alkalicoccus halolimnae]TXF84684.1 hypothetical protein FTX54_10850 [Alkalicoccus halolimnae]
MIKGTVMEKLGQDYLEKRNEETFIRVDDTLAITVSTFVSMFGDSEMTYSSLAVNENTTDAWLEIFKRWNEEGILPD